MDEWNKLDLHVHTQVGNTYNNEAEAENTGKYYNLKNLVTRNRINNLRLIAITNHNLINVSEMIKAAYVCRKTGTNVIPGIELDLKINSKKRYHVIVVFSEKTNIIDINTKLMSIIKKNKNNYLEINDLFEMIQGTECVIIPHGCKNPHGLKPRQSDEIDINDAIDLVNIITSSSSINVLFEHTKPYFNESFKANLLEKAKGQWLTVEEIAELERRAGTEYVGSDYRFSEYPIKAETRVMSKIWANPTFRGLQISCIFPTERIKAENNIINRVNYISKINIEKSKYFEKSEINLSSGLNSIIGESASGKTALLDIITTNLIDKHVIKDKDYDELCKDLNVTFYNQDNLPLNTDDLKIVIADNLYDSIRSAHETGNNKEILKLFNFEYNSESSVITKYKRDLNSYISNNSKILKLKPVLKENVTNFIERNKSLLINNIDNNEFIIDIPIFENLQKLKKYEDINKLLIKYLADLETMKEETKNIVLKLNDLGIKNSLLEKINEIDKEIKTIKHNIDLNYKKLSLSKVIYEKLNLIITASNNQINQKNAYIQNTKKLVHEDMTNISSNLKQYILNKMKNEILNLDFPAEEMINELDKNNNHKYIEVEYKNIDELLLVEENSGIVDVKNMKRILDNQFGKKAKDSETIKNIINIIQYNGKNVSLRIDELLNNIISTANIKIGLPNEQKILVSDLTPGLTAKMYIDYLFNVKILDGYNNVVVFDQPENDVDKAFIYDVLISKISTAKFNIQVIITSHEPLLVVNGDSNQIIKAEKKNHMIKYVSYKLDEYLDKNTVTNVISKYVDGNINAVKNRYEIYVGGKNEITSIL